MVFLKYIIIVAATPKSKISTYLEFVVEEDGLGHVNVDFYMFGLIVRVYEFCFAHERCVSAPVLRLEHWHSRGLLNQLHVSVEDCPDFRTVADDLVVDIDLVVDRDARGFTQALDPVRDLSAQA